jgi:hypothetical protein
MKKKEFPAEFRSEAYDFSVAAGLLRIQSEGATHIIMMLKAFVLSSLSKGVCLAV